MHVRRDGFDLRRDQISGERLDRHDPHGVLGRDRRDGRRAEHAECRKGFQVGLDAGAAAGVAAGDGERGLDESGHGVAVSFGAVRSAPTLAKTSRY